MKEARNYECRAMPGYHPFRREKESNLRGQITTRVLAAVALVALSLSTAVAQGPPGASAEVAHELMRQQLADQPGTDVFVVTVDSARRHHPAP